MDRSLDAAANEATNGPIALAAEPDSGATSPGARRFTMVLAVGMVVALAAIGVLQWRGGASSDRGAHAGETAPLFTLPAFNGQTMALASFRGQPVVLNFWASWCPPCRTEAPVLAKIASAQAGHVAFIGVNVRDKEQDARAFLAEYGVPYVNVRDVDGAVEPRYDSLGIPFTVFISADGVIERTWIGPLDEPRLLAFIEELR